MEQIFKPKPDYAQQELIESIEFSTDVVTGLDGSETRTRLRQFPRLRLVYTVNIFKQHPSYVEHISFFRNPPQEALIPHWTHATTLSRGLTAAPFKPGPLVLPSGPALQPLIENVGGNYILRQALSQVESADNEIVFLLPAFVNKELSAGLETSDFLRSSFEFTVPAYNEAIYFDLVNNIEPPLPYPLLNGLPILENAPNFSIQPNETTTLFGKELDFGKLLLRETYYKKNAQSFTFSAQGPGVYKLKQFINYTKGRLNPFYFKDPVTNSLELCRLASDMVQINYPASSLADAKLTLLRI